MIKNIAPTYASLSGWNALLPRRTVHDKAPVERRFRTIVIGAGYTGLGAARRLAELAPEQEVLVIDSSEVGEGASARNSGFLSILPSSPQATLCDSVDVAAHKQIRIATAGFEWLRDLVRRHEIDCKWDESAPRITAAATANGEKRAREARRKYENWGIPCREYDIDELRGKLGTEYYRYGYEPATRALVQPAALIRGLADNLPCGITLLEKTTVTGISKNSPYTVQTNRGAFEADVVMICNNSFARSLGFLRDKMIAIYTYGAFTAWSSEYNEKLAGQIDSWGVVPAHRMGTTLRKIAGRLLIRSGDSYERESSPLATKKMLTALLLRRFPNLKVPDLEYVWGGATAITHNGAFFFGEVHPGLYASVGCNGGGVVRGSVHGKLLAEMACGSQSALLTERLSLQGPSWIPPEPVRRLGVVSSIAVEQWIAGRER